MNSPLHTKEKMGTKKELKGDGKRKSLHSSNERMWGAAIFKGCFPDLLKDLRSQIQEPKYIPSNTDKRKPDPTSIVVKMTEQKRKGR